jgi:hypothetical protein
MMFIPPRHPRRYVLARSSSGLLRPDVQLASSDLPALPKSAYQACGNRAAPETLGLQMPAVQNAIHRAVRVRGPFRHEGASLTFRGRLVIQGCQSATGSAE